MHCYDIHDNLEPEPEEEIPLFTFWHWMIPIAIPVVLIGLCKLCLAINFTLLPFIYICFSPFIFIASFFAFVASYGMAMEAYENKEPRENFLLGVCIGLAVFVSTLAVVWMASNHGMMDG